MKEIFKGSNFVKKLVKQKTENYTKEVDIGEEFLGIAREWTNKYERKCTQEELKGIYAYMFRYVQYLIATKGEKEGI